MDDVIENWRLTLLHRTVLKLNNLEVSDLLVAMPKSEINSRDHYGRTALWWATQRADTSTLSKLIQRGADPNIPSSPGTSPLNLAFFRSYACARLLLNANADTTPVAGNNWPALPCAAYFGAPIDIIEKLIVRGNDINIVACSGHTALMLAAQEGHQHCCVYLISQDADLNCANDDGECALHLAICNGRSGPTRLLLAHGAQHSLKTNAGESILHYGAMYGDVATLEALQSVTLQGISQEDTITSVSHI